MRATRLVMTAVLMVGVIIQSEAFGANLRDSAQQVGVREAAAETIAHMGEPAQKYYPDIVKLLAAGKQPGETAMKRPNVVFILTDDHGYGDVGAHGNAWIKTPALDRLLHESIRFTDFHVGTTCAPPRAGLLTGHNATAPGSGTSAAGHCSVRLGLRLGF